MVNGLKQQSELALATLTHEDTNLLPATIHENREMEYASSILRYWRFDVALEARTLKEIGLPEITVDIDSIVAMDRADKINSHLEIGRCAGDRDLDDSLFSLSFDVRPMPGNFRLPGSKAEAAKGAAR